MAKQVWKYTLNVGNNRVYMPREAQVLSVVNQHEEVVLYALVDTGLPTLSETPAWEAEVVGTGWNVPDWADTDNFIGTVSTDGGEGICHVFARTLD